MSAKRNLSHLLKQAQAMQKQMQAVQKDLEQSEFESEAGGGFVKVRMNGKMEVLEIELQPEVLEEEKDFIEDLLITAMNKVLKKVQETTQSQMSQAAGPLMGGLNFPGS